jgi:hypothetical protein
VNTVVGSTGPMGNNSSTPAYTAPTNLGQLTDTDLGALSTGDVLRWAGDKWRNYSDTNLTDGGNF